MIHNGVEIKHAPKIFKTDCKIDWNKNIDSIHNLIRGLSPYPASWTDIHKENETIQLKIFESKKEKSDHNLRIGTIDSDEKTYLKVAVKGGFIQLIELQQAGKRRLNISEYLRGFQGIKDYTFSTKA